jgi:hypothetical protein
MLLNPMKKPRRMPPKKIMMNMVLPPARHEGKIPSSRHILPHNFSHIMMRLPFSEGNREKCLIRPQQKYLEDC